MTPLFSVNRARALFDEAAYREMVAMVDRARESVRLEFFLFGGPVAERMREILDRKRRQGVRVEVTLDRALGALPQVRPECRAMYRRLRQDGFDVALSDPRPLPDAPRRPAVCHNKIIVVDDREAMVGGMNVGSLFHRYHDVMIHLEGPASVALAQQFDRDRRGLRERRWDSPMDSAPLPPFQAPHENIALGPEESWARVLGTGIGRRTTRAALRQNVDTARCRVWIALSEIGRTDLLDAVIAAWRRGVDVRVLVDPLDTSLYLSPLLGPLRNRCPRGILNAHAIRALLAAGVPVRLYDISGPFVMLHLKMALFDDRSAIVGSTNWTRSGFEWIVETDVELWGGAVLDELRAQFLLDWGAALPATVPTRATRALCSLYERLFQR